MLRASVWVEDETIFAERFLGDAIDADVVFVALGVVWDLIGHIGRSFIESWAVELGCNDSTEIQSQ